MWSQYVEQIREICLLRVLYIEYLANNVSSILTLKYDYISLRKQTMITINGIFSIFLICIHNILYSILVLLRFTILHYLKLYVLQQLYQCPTNIHSSGFTTYRHYWMKWLKNIWTNKSYYWWKYHDHKIILGFDFLFSKIVDQIKTFRSEFKNLSCLWYIIEITLLPDTNIVIIEV